MIHWRHWRHKMHKMQQNHHNHAKLLHEFQFTYSRKSAENTPKTSQPQIRQENIRPCRISAENSIGRPNDRKNSAAV